MENLTTPEFEMMLMTAATEVMARWLNAQPDGGTSTRTHLASGAGLELLVQFCPARALGLRLVDSDGSYVALETRVFTSMQ